MTSRGRIGDARRYPRKPASADSLHPAHNHPKIARYDDLRGTLFERNILDGLKQLGGPRKPFGGYERELLDAQETNCRSGDAEVRRSSSGACTTELPVWPMSPKALSRSMASRCAVSMTARTRHRLPIGTDW